jgi:hypothetical protein
MPLAIITAVIAIVIASLLVPVVIARVCVCRRCHAEATGHSCKYQQ